MWPDAKISSTPPKTKIFVGRLPQGAETNDLRRLFERFGIVTECDILNRYAFVHMKTEEMAARAIRELDNSEFMGVQISVEASTGKRSTRGGFGPIRGRGGGRGFSRGSPYLRTQGGHDGRMGFHRSASYTNIRNAFDDGYGRGYYPPSRGTPKLDRENSQRPYSNFGRYQDEDRGFSAMRRNPPGRVGDPGITPFLSRSSDAQYTSDMFRRRSPTYRVYNPRDFI